MMVIFLVGLVTMILMRTLRKDYARYSREEDLDDLVCVCVCVCVCVLNCEVSGKIVCQVVGVSARMGCTNGTDDFLQGGRVTVLLCDVLP